LFGECLHLFVPLAKEIFEIFEPRTKALVLYLVRKNGTLKPDFASLIKQKYQNSYIGCICAGDCHFTRELALASGADFFLVSTYDLFIEDLGKNIQFLNTKTFDSHTIERKHLA